MRFYTKSLALGASLFALNAVAAPAFAQTSPTPVAAEDDSVASDNEIIVQARRRDESLQDVPQTVNVVTAAQIEKLNLRNFQEIQTIVPGLTLNQTSSFSSQATVRGVAFIPEASGNNPSVEFYLNDAVISSNFLFQSTFDFGQFELQRGPQGTFRGRASPSGSIAVSTRRPDLKEVGAVFNGTITDLHARKVDGAFNIPIIADVLAIRLAGVVDNNRANFVHSIKEGDGFNEGPYRRTKSIRGSVRFEPADWVRLDFMYQNLHAEEHVYNQVVSNSLIVSGAPQTTRLIGPFERLAIDDIGTYNRQDHDVYIANAEIRFAGQKLNYVGSYLKQDFGSTASQDPGDFFAPPRTTIVQRTLLNPTPVGAIAFEPVCTNEQGKAGFNASTGTFFQCTHGFGTRESHELRLSSEERIAGIFDYVVGVFQDEPSSPSNVNSETVFGNTATGAFQVLARTGRLRRTKTKEQSVFGNLTAHLLDDKLEVSGGLRRIDYKQVSSLQVPVANINRVDAVGQKATIYTASAKYKITPDVMVYALTGSSFRPTNPVVGDFSVGPTGGGPSPRELMFTLPTPEKSKSYEIGAKTSFLDGRGRFNISAYHQTFENYPFRAPGAGVFFVNYQAGAGGVIAAQVGQFNFVSPVPVKVTGLEAEASLQVLERWSLGANASYADGKIKGGTIACNASTYPVGSAPTLAQIQAAAGGGETLAMCTGVNQPVTTTPKFSANVQSEYGFGLGSNADAFVRGLATIYGKTQGDPNNAFDSVPSYALVNLYAGVRDPDGAWEITLFAKNILKEREILSANLTPEFSTGFRAGAAFPGANTTFNSEYRRITVTSPREFGITARIAFGSR